MDITSRVLSVIVVMVCLARIASAQELSTIGQIPPFVLSGSLGANTSARSSSGVDRFGSPVSWTVNASATASLYGIQMPFTLIISEQDRNFQQPFNQFGISPTYKWFTLHLGYRSMSMGRYTLAGMSFLGAGLEANPGQLRLGAMYGRFQRAVEEDTSQKFAIPAFKRMGYALKLGFGSASSYVDFSFFHAKDDSNSLERPLKQSTITPSENSVLGVSSRFTIIPQLALEVDGAASLLTRNLRSREINTNDVPDILSNIQSINLSTTLLYAMRAGLNFTIPRFGMRVDFERVEPEFSSLGAYYLNGDRQMWTLSPRFDLPQQKIRFSGSIGLQRDNLLNQKRARTDRIIGSANIGWTPTSVFGIDGNYTNFSTAQQHSQLLNDSLLVRNVSQTFTLSPRVTLASPEQTQFMTIVATHQAYNDLSARTLSVTSTSANTVSAIYNLAFIKKKMSTGGSLLYSGSTAAGVSVTTLGGSVNGSTTIMEDRLTLSGSLSYSYVTSSVASGASILNQSVSVSYRPGEFDYVTLQVGAMQRIAGETDTGGHEFTGTLSYSRNLSWTPWTPEEEQQPEGGEVPPE